MSSGVVVNAEPAPAQEPAPGLSEHRASSGGAVERWLDGHLNMIALAIVAAGFVVRVIAAGRSYLNPDEALHYLLLNQTSAYLAYKASLTNAHPPLIYLLVHYWSFLGRSELMVRFPSVLAGTALCWVAYKWIGMIFGKAPSILGLILVAFSPAMIALSAELRSYAVLLFCETAALYFVEMALREKSADKMWFFSMFLWLAILAHYSALFFVLAVGVYALVRIAESELPRKVIAAWAGGQAVAVGIYGFLYVTHVSKIRNSISAWAMPYDQSYFHPDRTDLFSFTKQRTLDIFLFIFENQYVAQAMLLLWVAAVAFLLIRELFSRRDNLAARHSGVLLFLPFVAVWGAAIAGFYPYVGSRHTVFLAPFMIAGLSFLLAAVYGRKVWAAIVIAALLVGASNTSGKTFEPFITRENSSRTLMTAAMNHIRQTIPQGDVILTDYESGLMLVYYLCGPKVILPPDLFNLPSSRVNCNGYTIASFPTWSVQPSFFLSHFGDMVQAQGLTSGNMFWVFQSGWGVTLGRKLPWTAPKFRCLVPQNFGANISVIPFVVDQDLSPAATVTDCPPPAFNSFVD